MESKQAFGAYIKQKRSELGYSQRELAGKLFVTESAVSKWERGVSYPDITQITPLCEALQVSEHELVTASDDWRQRKLEKEAAAHKKVRIVWLISLAVLYIGTAIAAIFGPNNSSLQPVAIIVCCLWLACFTHVPVIAKNNKVVLTMISSYVVLNALMVIMLAQQGQIGIADAGTVVAALLFSFSLVLLPIILKLLSEHLISPVFKHKAFVCLFADSVFLLMLVYVFNTKASITLGFQFCGIAIVLLIPVWVTFLLIRYLPTELPYRLAGAFALFGFWVFLAGGLINILFGLPFDLHLKVNFLDWSTYPAVNDNLCWTVMIICLLVAGILCITAAKNRKKENDRIH